MTYTPTDAAALEAKHEKERAELALLALIETQDLPRVMAAMSGDTELWFMEKLHLHSYAADATIVLTAPTLQDALVTAEKLNPLHLMRVKDSSLSFVPADFITMKQQESESAHITDIGPWAYTVSGLRTHTEDHTLFFFIDGGPHGERTLKVEIQIKEDPNTYRRWATVYGRGEVFVQNCTLTMDHAHWTENDKYAASGGDQPNRYVCY